VVTAHWHHPIRRITMNQTVKAISRNAITIALLLGGLCSANFAQGNSKTDDVRKAISAAEAKFSALFASGDIKALAALYAEDGQIMPPNAAISTGRAAIQAFWQGARDAGVTKVELKTLETSGTGGDTTYEVGSYVLYNATGEALDDGKYIVIWRRQGRSWLMYRDIWNSNRK
jgi:ketosteroid isomerase-like protein